MNNPHYLVYYRLPISGLLLDRVAAFCRARRKAFSRRILADLIVDRLPDFERSSIRFLSLSCFEEYIITLFSKKDRGLTLYFRDDVWENLRRSQRALAVDMGSFLRLALSSYCFSHGALSLPVKEIVLTMCRRDSRQYSIVLTKEVASLLRETQKSRLPLSVGSIVRAAYLFRAGFGRETPPADAALHRVASSKTGWERTSFRCGLFIKSLIDKERARFRLPIPVLVSHALYSFLLELL
jgi:hypothetical protein